MKTKEVCHFVEKATGKKVKEDTIICVSEYGNTATYAMYMMSGEAFCITFDGDTKSVRSAIIPTTTSSNDGWGDAASYM